MGWVVFLLLALLSAPRVFASHDCFPIERLPRRLQAPAKSILLSALDHEALFTVFSDLKPISNGFAGFPVPGEVKDSPRIRDAKKIARALKCGDLEVVLHRYEVNHDGQGFYEYFFVNRARVRQLVQDKANEFLQAKIRPTTRPYRIIKLVDQAERLLRFRLFGHLFGYPDCAVEFFVESEKEALPEGEVTDRKFISLPTHRDPQGFIWAVPPEYAEGDSDRALRASAMHTLKHYRKLRARFIGPSRAGVVALARHWVESKECESKLK